MKITDAKKPVVFPIKLKMFPPPLIKKFKRDLINAMIIAGTGPNTNEPIKTGISLKSSLSQSQPGNTGISKNNSKYENEASYEIVTIFCVFVFLMRKSSYLGPSSDMFKNK